MAPKNRLGTTNGSELDREEEILSKQRALELFEGGLLDKEAARLGVNRQAVIKFACDGHLANVAKRERELVS